MWFLASSSASSVVIPAATFITTSSPSATTMLLKKSTITLCSSSTALSNSSYYPSPTNTKRGYRRVHRGQDHRHHPPPYKQPQDHHPQPHRWPTNPHPTPYEVLNLPRRGPYSKRRFNELVKLYHPDRNGHPPTPDSPALSPTAKLDRYRLIVLAHSILSDPSRRRQYDAYGAGWAPSTTASTPFTPDARGRYPDGKSWRQQPGNAANNATWEDWEQWYAERDAACGVATGGKTEPIFMSNGLFAMFVVFATALAAIGQYTWAENHAHRMAMLKMQTHDDLLRELRAEQDRDDVHRGEGEARIEAYLRRKEGTYYVPPSYK